MSQQLNLGGITLNVSVNKVPPFCDFKIVDNEIIRQYSTDFELLSILESKYNFRSNLIYANQTFGRLVNGKYWTGVIGHVVNSTSEMGMCCLSITEKREKYVDFSSIISYDHLTFLSKCPGLSSRKWIIFSPFTVPVWLLIVTSLIVLAISIRLSSRMITPHTNLCSSRIFTQLVQIFLKQQVYGIPSSVRVFYSLWLLSSLILSNSYGGEFYSIMALPRQQPPIDTVQELVELANQDKVLISTYESSSYITAFLEASTGVYHQIGENIRRTRSKMGESEEELIAMVEHNPTPTVFIATRLGLLLNRRFHANPVFHIASSDLANDNYAAIFPKHSRLYAPFNRVIRHCLEHGLIDRWIQDVRITVKTQTQPSSIYETPKVVSLKLLDFFSIFMIWIFGSTIAMIILLCEYAFLRFIV